VQRHFFAALYGLTQFPEILGGDVAKRAPEQPSRKNGGFGGKAVIPDRGQRLPAGKVPLHLF
jgi:hypothetical protein